MSLDTQLYLLVFVVTLDVAVGTQLKQLCVVDIQQRVSGYTEDCNSLKNLLRYLTSPHNKSELNFRLSLKYLESY